MKRKTSRRISILLALCMALALLPGTVSAAETDTTVGPFIVTGGTAGTDYTYSDSTLSILTDTPLTIRNAGNGYTTSRIEISEKNTTGAVLTLAGVRIDVSVLVALTFELLPAFLIPDDYAHDVTITLAEGSENVLISGYDHAGLQKGSTTTDASAIGTLTITGTGKLTATGGGNFGEGGGGAGIGSGVNYNPSENSYYSHAANITINGGTVIATGGGGGAGIGGGGGYESGGDGANITINGGTVIAAGDSGGAGIGGGGSIVYGGDGYNITINGGTVTATAGGDAAGIGGGFSNGDGYNITITGGTVTANGGYILPLDEYFGAGIGGCNGGDGYNITISGGNVTTTSSSYAAGIGSNGDYGRGYDIKITGGTITNKGTGYIVKSAQESTTVENAVFRSKGTNFFVDNDGEEWMPAGYIATVEYEGGYYWHIISPDMSVKPPVIYLSSVTIAGQTATTVEWSPVINAAYYSITVYDVTKGSYVYEDQIMDGSVTTFVLDHYSIVEGNTYEIYVKAIDINGNESEKSNLISWIAKSVTSPEDNAMNQPGAAAKQEKDSKNCTWASVANLLRRYAIDNGIPGWENWNDLTIKANNSSMYWKWDYTTSTGSHIVSTNSFVPKFSDMSEEQLKNYYIELLEKHPEGIVIFNQNGSWSGTYDKAGKTEKYYELKHAVVLTDYDPKTDTFYCVDSGNGVADGRIKLGESSMLVKLTSKGQKVDFEDFSGKQMVILKLIDRVCYITGVKDAKKLQSSSFKSDCPVEMRITINGVSLDSRTISGTESVTWGTMKVSGTGDDRTIEAFFNGDYAKTADVQIELFGTGAGDMDFTVTHLFSDGSEETHNFSGVPLSDSTIGTVQNIHPQCSATIEFTDLSTGTSELWVAAPDETAIQPATDYGPEAEPEAESAPLAPTTYTVTVTTSPAEGGSVTGDGTYDEGEAVAVKATPASGYRFVRWTEDGKQISTNATYTFNAEGNRTLTAVFEKNSSGGSSSGGSSSGGSSSGGGSSGGGSSGGGAGGTGSGSTTPSTPDVPDTPDTPETPWANPFTDVSESDWFYDSVAYVVQNGLMTGVGNGQFNPSGTTTRGMIMTILARLEGVDTSGGNPWYQPGMEWAMRVGVTDGTGPETDITREQFVTMLWRYVGEPTATGSLSAYSDATNVNNWARDAMAWAIENGIIYGTDSNKIDPQGSALRSQAAAMFTRFCKNI